MNKIFLMGNLGKDPELKFHNGRAKLVFPMATTEKWTDKETGEKRERTDWHNVAVWGKRAEKLAALLSKGERIVVEGRIEHSSYDASNGEKKYWTEVKAQDIYLTGRRQVPPQLPEPDVATLAATAGLSAGDGRKTEASDQIPF